MASLMTSDFERTWKEMLFRHFPGGNKENYEKRAKIVGLWTDI
jgi:hypothetical protein